MKRYAALCFFLVTGCATTPPPLAPGLSELTVRASAKDRPDCSSPRHAVRKISKGFTYGCYCGAGYPGLEHPSKKPEAELSDPERDELIAQYLHHRSVDDIDRICQMHDICWTYYRRKDYGCNRHFYLELKKLMALFEEQASERHELGRRYRTPEMRCANLARDMAFAGLLFQKESEEYGFFEKALNTAFYVISSPITAAYALVFIFSDPVLKYPAVGEWCKA